MEYTRSWPDSPSPLLNLDPLNPPCSRTKFRTFKPSYLQKPCVLHVANNGDLLHGVAQRERPLMVRLEQPLASLWSQFPYHIRPISKDLRKKNATSQMRSPMDAREKGCNTAEGSKASRSHSSWENGTVWLVFNMAGEGLNTTVDCAEL